MENGCISPAVAARLPRYHRYLSALLENSATRVSSNELSSMMGVTASQIRQDLATFGAFGQQGYGYGVEYLHGEISKILGVDKPHRLVIIGAGNIGRAIACHGLKKLGFDVKALFDTDKKLIGTKICGTPVYAVASLSGYLKALGADIAVIAVPAAAAKSAAELVFSLGVRAVWNFTNVDIDAPEGGLVENVHLTDSIMTLALRLNLLR